jgi:pyrroloquinoline quinone (PQQ) biosynthesis protein C
LIKHNAVVATESAGSAIVDEICALCLQSAERMSWLVEPLTPGRAKAYVLQHVLRNRLLSAVIRPAWVSRCSDQDVVHKTLGQMREELVFDDEIGRPHTELIFELGRSIGLSDAEMMSSAPVPLVEAAFNIWENLARTRHWTIGWLSSSVGEYLLATLSHHNFSADGWKRALGLSDTDVFFFSYHQHVDTGHAGRDVWTPIAKQIVDGRSREDVLSGTRAALTALSLYYRGVAELGDELDARSARTA